MAGLKPFFLTGANAKIMVNNKTLAYVNNLTYSINVNHATPTVLGMYEPSSVEPLSYVVTGSFSVVRYIADITSDTGSSPVGVQERGNGVGSWGAESASQKFGAGLDFGSSADGRVYDNLNPKELHKATGFQIEIYQKFNGGQRAVAKIRGARITKADFSLSKKSVATQTFNFTATYADEDSFIADFSGLGQQFS